MGLALGLLGSAFTLLNAYLFDPSTYRTRARYTSLSWDTETTRHQRFGLADYEALEPEARRFAGVAATQDVSVMQDAVSTRGLLVTGNYFELLGARPAVGRLLRRDDAAARGARPVVVLSHERGGPGTARIQRSSANESRSDVSASKSSASRSRTRNWRARSW